MTAIDPTKVVSSIVGTPTVFLLAEGIKRGSRGLGVVHVSALPLINFYKKL